MVALFEAVPTPYITRKGVSRGSSGIHVSENNEGKYIPSCHNFDIWWPHLFHWNMLAYYPF